MRTDQDRAEMTPRGNNPPRRVTRSGHQRDFEMRPAVWPIYCSSHRETMTWGANRSFGHEMGAVSKMGFYQTRSKNPINEFTIQPTLTRGGPAAPTPRAPEIKGPGPDYEKLRRAKPVNTMLPKSTEWVASLPPNVRPNALVAAYPRIVNLIALQWRNPRACREYLDDLLTDHRGTRQGFPLEVYSELSALRDYQFQSTPHLSLED